MSRNVACICADPGVPVFGAKGSSQHFQAIARALRQSGAEIEIFATRIGGDAPAGLENVRIHPLPALPKGEPAAREKAALAANESLRVALEESGTTFDLLYERYSLWSFAGMEWAQERDVPGIVEVNAPLIEEQATHRVLVDRAAATEVARRLFAAASGIVAVSEEVARYVRTFPSTAEKVHVLANGVDASRFPEGLAPALRGADGSFTVGFIGSLKPWHGLPVLAEAFAKLHRTLPHARLLIVGDGPERAAIEAQISMLGLRDATHFTGAVAADEVPSLLASMDVATAPYAQDDRCYFSPLKVFEYMAAERAIVASRAGQLTTLLEHGTNAWLVPPGNAAALADSLSTLAADPALRARLGRAARAAALRRHTWTRVVEDILAIADEAATARASTEAGIFCG